MQNCKINLNVSDLEILFDKIGLTNESYCITSTISFEYLKEYTKNGNIVHYKDSLSNEVWVCQNSKYYTLYFKESNGTKYYKKYNVKGKLISFKFYI